MAQQLKDLNAGVMAKVMNQPLSATSPEVTPQATPQLSQAPKIMDPAPSSQVVAPVPQAATVTDFPEIPGEVFGEPAKTGITQEQLPAPGTAPQSDKDMNFAKLRTKLQSTEAELVELKSKYFSEDGKTLKPELTQSKQETERLKQELEQAQNKLARYNLMDDPRFVKKYQSKMGKIEADATRILKDFGVEPSLLKELTSLNPKQRHDLLVTKAPDTQFMIEPLLAQMDSVRIEQNQELDDWKNTLKNLETERNVETEFKVKAAKEALHSSVTRELEEAGHPLLKTIPGNEKWNAGVNSLKQTMRETLEVNDPKLQTKMLFSGVMAPIYQALMLKERARANDLQRQLDILGGVRPGVDSRGTGGSEPSVQKPKEAATPYDAAAANKKRFFG